MNIEKFLKENKKLLIILVVGLIIIFLIYKKQENIQAQETAGSLTPFGGLLYIGTPKYFGRKVFGLTNNRLYVIGGNKVLYYIPLDSNGKPNQDNYLQYWGDIFTLGVNTNAVIGVGGGDDINSTNDPPTGLWRYINGFAQNVCVLKNSIWVTGTDSRAYYNVGSWVSHGSNFLVTYVFGDVTKQNPGAIFCIKKDDNQLYYSELNVNGTPKVQDRWNPLPLSGKTIQDVYVYNNALWCIASDNNPYYCKLDSNGIPNGSWISFYYDASVKNLQQIAITKDYVFTYDDANNVYCANNTDSVNGPIKNINFKKWTKIAQGSKPIIQLTTNDNSIWFLFNDGTIAYKLISQLISEQAVIYAEQEAIIMAEQEALIKAEQEIQRANRLKAEQEALIKAEQEALIKAEQEALIKAEQETQRANRLKAEQEALIKAEQEALIIAEQETQRANRLKAEQEALIKAEQENKNLPIVITNTTTSLSTDSTTPTTPTTSSASTTSESSSNNNLYYILGGICTCICCIIIAIVIYMVTKKKKSNIASPTSPTSPNTTT